MGQIGLTGLVAVSVFASVDLGLLLDPPAVFVVIAVSRCSSRGCWWSPCGTPTRCATSPAPGSTAPWRRGLRLRRPTRRGHQKVSPSTRASAALRTVSDSAVSTSPVLGATPGAGRSVGGVAFWCSNTCSITRLR